MTAELLTLSSYNRDHLPAIRTAITDVYGEVWSAESPGDPFHSVERFAERLTGHASSEGWACVIGEVSGDVVGFAYGRPDSVGEWQTVIDPVDSGVRDYGAKGTFGLCDIMVRVPWRGQKIARAIHDELMRNRTEHHASLLVDSARPGMRTLYEKWGYRRVGSMQPFPDSPRYDAMVLNLSEVATARARSPRP